MDVWVGTPGKERPFSLEKPAILPGDGTKQTIAIAYSNGGAEAELVMPKLSPGQVCWIQPVLEMIQGELPH